MDFLLDALDEIAAEIFGSVAHLLNLDLDLIFVDTTSTYWEVDVADELADLQDTVDDDGVSRPVENGARAFGHSKDFRTDLPQVVIAMAVTSDGVPVRCWTFPGNTADTSTLRDHHRAEDHPRGPQARRASAVLRLHHPHRLTHPAKQPGWVCGCVVTRPITRPSGKPAAHKADSAPRVLMIFGSPDWGQAAEQNIPATARTWGNSRAW